MPGYARVLIIDAMMMMARPRLFFNRAGARLTKVSLITKSVT